MQNINRDAVIQNKLLDTKWGRESDMNEEHA